MNICRECEHYGRAIYLRYTKVWIDPVCRSIDVRRNHKSIITGVPGEVYCKRARRVDAEPDDIVMDCPHWSERHIDPVPTIKRPWYRRMFKEGE